MTSRCDTVTETPSRNNVFSLMSGRTWLVIAFTLIWSIVFYKYLVLDKVFIFSQLAIDSVSQFYPVDYFRIKNYLAGQIPFWSFQLDLGTNIYGIMTNISPFDILLVPFGPDHFHTAIHLAVFLKLFGCCVFFHAFLRRLNIATPWALTGALLFTFNGYLLVNSHWYHYSNYAVFIALFLLFFEVWFQDGRWLPLVLVLGLIPLKGELQLLQMVAFGSVYVFFRAVNVFGWSWHVVRTFFWLGVFFSLGVCIQSYLLLPNILTILSSSRAAAAVDHISLGEKIAYILRVENWEVIKIIFARMTANDLLGSWTGYHGMYNYFEDSTLYSGILTLLLLPLCFVRTAGTRLLWSFPFVCSIIFLFPQMRWALNGFASGTFKYISLYVSTFSIICCVFLLQNWVDKNSRSNIVTTGSGRINWLIVLLCWAGLIVVCLIDLLFGSFLSLRADSKVVQQALFLVVTYVSLLVVSWKFPRCSWSRYLLVAVIIIEIVLFSRQTVSRNRGALPPTFVQQGRFYFSPSTQSALHQIQSTDTSFYRIEKGYNDGHLNDAMIQGYNGTSAYFGFVSSGVVQFYRHFGLSLNSPRLSSYRYGMEKRADLQTLLAVKYFLCRTDEECGGLQNFTLRDEIDGVKIYQNQNVNGFARMYYAQCPAIDFQSYSSVQKDRLTKTAVITEQKLPDVQLDCRGAGDIEGEARNQDQFILEQWQQDYFKGNIQVTRPGILFFPIPYDRGWQVMVNGIPADLYPLDYGFMGIALQDRGPKEVVLHYQPPFMGLAIVVSVLALAFSLLMYWRYPCVAGYRNREKGKPNYRGTDDNK
ncbi:YfhO family protein [Desulfogranum japonicum]|uniref:YfhO family protein n=1 Tax=Desulfogranum japonicum TaxID=231447 RepID=UPI0004202C6C|nr:YfhO family protein [Desulfogranum japonicum]